MGMTVDGLAGAGDGNPDPVPADGAASRRRSSLGRTALLRGLFISFFVGAAGFVFLLIWAAHRAHSLGGGLAYLRGDSVYAVASGPIQVPVGGASSIGSTTVELLNLSGAPVRIVGYNNPCLCVSFVGLPLSVGPHERAELRVNSRVTDELRRVSVMLLTDCAGQGGVPVEISILPRGQVHQ